MALSLTYIEYSRSSQMVATSLEIRKGYLAETEFIQMHENQRIQDS